MKKRKFNLSGIVALIIAVLVLAVVVPINIIVNYYDKDFDMTPSSMYTLSDTTVNLVNETKDHDIEIYFMQKLDNLRDIPEYLPLYHTMIQLEKYDNITLTDVVPDEEPALLESLNPNGNLNFIDGDIVVKCGSTIKKIDAATIFPYDSNGVTTYAGEELIAGAIRIVTNGSLPVIYFMTGHGEKTINDNYSTFADILKSTNNYEAAELDLSKEDSVPEDAAILFLAGPQTDITDDEKDKIMNYAQNGGAMAFFLPPVEDHIRFANIEDILAEYELEMNYNIVEETNPDNMLNNPDGEQDPYTFMVEYTPASDSFTVDLTSEINSIISEGSVVGGISNTRTFNAIGSGSAFIERSSLITNAPTVDTLTGIYSYTAQSIACGGDEKTAEYAESLSGQQLAPAYYSYNKQNGSKLIAVGTADVLDSEKMSASIAVSMQLVQNSLIWLFNSDYDMNIGNKGVTFDYMSFSSADEATSALRIFTVVPICIAVIGLLVWLKRRHS